MTDEHMQAAVRLLLARKQEIEATRTGQFVATHRWLMEAVELLLTLQMEQRK